MKITTSAPFSLVCLCHSLYLPLFFSFSSPFCVSLSCSFFFFLPFLYSPSLFVSLPTFVCFHFSLLFIFPLFFYRAPSLAYLSASQQQTNFEFPSKMLSILQNRLLKIGMNLGLKLGKVLAINIFLLDLWEKIKAWTIQLNLLRQQYTMKTWTLVLHENQSWLVIEGKDCMNSFLWYVLDFATWFFLQLRKVLRLPYVLSPISILGSVGKWKFLCMNNSLHSSNA